MRDTNATVCRCASGLSAMSIFLDVSLAQERRGGGQRAIRQGNLDAAAKLGNHSVSRLSTISSRPSAPPILFLEPSCWTMFVEDYRELKIEDADTVSNGCFLDEK